MNFPPSASHDSNPSRMENNPRTYRSSTVVILYPRSFEFHFWYCCSKTYVMHFSAGSQNYDERLVQGFSRIMTCTGFLKINDVQGFSRIMTCTGFLKNNDLANN